LRDAVPTRRARGFTLVELLIVVVLLGIVSAIVVPALGTQRHDAVTSALRSNITQVQMVLEVQHQYTSDGSWPAALDPDWFVNLIVPQHPDNMAGVPLVEVVIAPGSTHPGDKLVHAASAGAYWYNSANGTFRARVKEQETRPETLDFYNEVNFSTLGDLGALVDSAAPAQPGGLAQAAVGELVEALPAAPGVDR